MSYWWRWVLVRPDEVAPSWMVGVPPLLIFPCTIKSRSSLLALAHPGRPGKRAVKQLWCVEFRCLFIIFCMQNCSWRNVYRMFFFAFEYYPLRWTHGIMRWQRKNVRICTHLIIVCVNIRWLPVYVNDDDKQLAVMSLAFFLNTRNDAVIWRGPKKDSV